MVVHQAASARLSARSVASVCGRGEHIQPGTQRLSFIWNSACSAASPFFIFSASRAAPDSPASFRAEQARRFLEIRWLSAPASLANLVLLGWLLGVQYARAPVILLVVGNILNIVLDVWLVMGLHMNVQGAALATVIAEYATLLIGLLMVRKILKLRGISGGDLPAAHGERCRLTIVNRPSLDVSRLINCARLLWLAMGSKTLGGFALPDGEFAGAGYQCAAYSRQRLSSLAYH